MQKVVLAVALCGSAVALAKGPQKAGNWHVTVTMEMPGMPVAPPPRSFDQCVTPEQADDPKKSLRSQDPECEPADVKVAGNQVSYKLVCHKHGGTQTGSGEMTYGADAYSGTMTMEMTNPRGGGPIKVIQHVSGQRTGDCAK
ncbi:MAG: DUF3617 domain-containing protein [Polyangia bacterium]